MAQQTRTVTGILGQYLIHLTEYRHGAGTHILEVADGRRHHIQNPFLN